MASEKSLLTLEFLQKNFGERYTRAGIAELLGIEVSAVSGAVNSFLKKGMVEQTEENVPSEIEGKKATLVKYVTLTEAGLTWDPIAEEEAKKERLAIERAQAKAAKAAAKAAMDSMA